MEYLAGNKLIEPPVSVDKVKKKGIVILC
jgi:hypothetical protein